MKKLAILIISTIVGAAAYGQYVSPVGTAQWFKKIVYVGADTTNPTAIFRPNGNVGIGTTTPTETLSIKGTLDLNNTRNGYKYLVLSNTMGHGFGIQHVGTGVYSAILNVDTNHVLLKAETSITSGNAYFATCGRDGYIMGFGSSALTGSSNIMRFDSITKYLFGVDDLSTSPNTRWLNASMVACAGMYNNGWLTLASGNNPTQALDVSGSVKIDSSLILYGEVFIDTDTAYTIGNNIANVILNYTTTVDTADITLPPNPANGQIVAITANLNNLFMLKILPNTGQNIAFNSSRGRATPTRLRYREPTSTWYLW